MYAQDTIYIPLKLRFGGDLVGPAFRIYDKNILNVEGYFSYDQSERRALMIGAGYSNYKYSQDNYDYETNGMFARAGFDFNLLKPKKSSGIYWGGIGLHYGISGYSYEVPSFTTENYWGTATSSVPKKTSMAHFVEATPGVRAEIFRNLSIGWTISLRFMLSSGAGSDLRPLYIPGFGNGSKNVSSSISYFISWNIPYRTKRIIIQPEEEEEEEEVPVENTIP